MTCSKHNLKISWQAHLHESEKQNVSKNKDSKTHLGILESKHSSRPGWVELWATWSSGRCPCSWQGGGTRWSLRSFPTQTMLWFYAMLWSWLAPGKVCKAGSKPETSAAIFHPEWLDCCTPLLRLCQPVKQWGGRPGLRLSQRRACCSDPKGWHSTLRNPRAWPHTCNSPRQTSANHHGHALTARPVGTAAATHAAANPRRDPWLGWHRTGTARKHRAWRPRPQPLQLPHTPSEPRCSGQGGGTGWGSRSSQTTSRSYFSNYFWIRKFI